MTDSRFANRLQDNGRRFVPQQDQRLVMGETTQEYFSRGGVAHIMLKNETAMCGGVTGVATIRKSANCIACFRAKKLRSEGKPIHNRDVSPKVPG